MNSIIKNIEQQQVVLLKDLVSIREHEVVSRTLHQSEHTSITLFAFAQGEEISTHASSGDALVTILQGKARIRIDNKEYNLCEHESILMPANKPHALYATEAFKMSLTVIFKAETKKETI